MNGTGKTYDEISKRYIVTALINKTNEYEQYLAYDKIQNKIINIKILNLQIRTKREVNEFINEFFILKRLNHKNFVNVYESGRFTDKRYYYTTEPLKGVKIKDALKNQNISTIKKYFFKLLDILASVHILKLEHLGLNFDNILIDKNGEIKIADFGLDVKLYSNKMQSLSFKNKDKISCIAPEVLTGNTKTYRCDLFSLGVIFYELLTGKKPFPIVNENTTSYLEILFQETPDKISKYNNSVSEKFENIILNCIKTNPLKRFLPSSRISIYYDKLCEEKALKTNVLNFHITGRKKQAKLFNKLLNDFDKMNYNTVDNFSIEEKTIPNFIILSGPLGCGKNSLLYGVVSRLFLENSAFINISDDMRKTPTFVENVSILKQIMEKTIGICPEQSEAINKVIIRCFPELINNPLLEKKSINKSKNKKNINELYYEISNILIEASRKEKLIIHINNFQNIDEVSLNFLNYLKWKILGENILFILTNRSEELSRGNKILDFISNLKNKEEITIKGLDEEETLSYLEKTFSKDPLKGRFAGLIYTESRGNIYYIRELLKIFLENKILYFKDSKWIISEEKFHKFFIPHSLHQVLLYKLQKIDESERLICDSISISGKAIEKKMLENLLQMDKDRLAKSIENLIQKEIIREQDGKICFYNIKLMDFYYNEIETNFRSKMHKKIAEYLESENADPREIAHHYHQTSSLQKSFDYSIEAGEKAYKKCLYVCALNYYTIANSMLKQVSADYQTQKKLYYKLIKLFKINKKPKLLIRHLGKTLQFIRHQESKEEIIKLYMKLGKTFSKISKYKTAIKYYKLAKAKTLKIFDDKLLAKVYYRMGKLEVTQESGEYKEEKKVLLNKALLLAEKLDDKSLQAKCHLVLGILYSFSDKLELANEHIKKSMDYAIEINYSKILAKASWQRAIITGKLKHYQESINYFIHSINLFDRLGMIKEKIMSLNGLGYTYCMWGRPEEAIYYFKQSLEYNLEADDPKEKSITLHNIGNIYYLLNDYDTAIIYLKRSLEVKNAIPNIEKINGIFSLSKTYSYLGYAYLKADKMEETIKSCNLSEKYFNLIGSNEANYEVEGELILLKAMIQAFNKNLEMAEFLINEAKRFFSGDYNIGLVYYDFAHTLYLSKIYSLAKKYFNIARQYLEKVESKYLLSKIDYYIAKSTNNETGSKEEIGKYSFAKLYQISQEFEKALTPEKLYNSILSNFIYLTNAQKGYLYLKINDKLVFKNGLNNKGKEILKEKIIEKDLYKLAFKQHNTFITYTTKNEETINVAEIINENIKKVICIQLSHKSDILGLIYLEINYDSDFPENIKIMIKTLSQFVSLSLRNLEQEEKLYNYKSQLENSENENIKELKKVDKSLKKAYDKMNEELALAKSIQKSILTDDYKKIENINFYVDYLPVNKVGGDYYNIANFERQNITRIFIADAVGHDVQGALSTIIINKEYDMIKRQISNPEGVLEYLNNIFCTKYTFKSYFSCFLADINFNNMTLTYSSAAHPTQFVIKSAQNEIIPLDKKEMLISFKENLTYPTTEVKIEEGDKILFFTDGIFLEYDRHGTEYGMQNLRKSIQKSMNKNINEICHLILDDLNSFMMYAKRTDDITLIGLEIKGSS